MTAHTDTDDLVVNLVKPATAPIIMVVGVGGGGGNAVAQMHREGIPGVQLMVCNTDSKALCDSPVADRLQLGPGLGAGGRPEKGRQLAEADVEKIRASFASDVQMVFITAGMGGGTGTGASPVIAREAKAKGLLTVGIVTIPFLFERERQIDKALDGLERLAAEVDALLVINNERLMEIYPTMSVINAFRKADETLTVAVRSIVDIINMHGRVILDFRDVDMVLRGGGVAVISTGYGEGPERLRKAIDQALYSPLLNRHDVYRSRRIVFAIATGHEDGPEALRVEEMNEISDFTARFNTDVETKWGFTLDPSLGSRVKLTLLASGFHLFGSDADSQRDEPAPDVDVEGRDERRSAFYGQAVNHRHTAVRTTRPRVYLYGLNDLDNEALVQLVDDVPTRSRTAAHMQLINNNSGASAAAASASVASAPAPEDPDKPVTICFDMSDHPS